jgi:hypothetical protein
MRQRRRHILPALWILASLVALGCSGHQNPAGSGLPAGLPVAEGSTPTTAVAPSANPSSTESPEVSATSTASPSPLGSCPIFPADNIWHTDVSRLPGRSNSAVVIASIGLDDQVHADFGSGLWEGGPIGIPITTVRSGQAKVRVSFEYADESDQGPYPIPASAKIEGGPDADGDRHVILLDKTRCTAYELFAAYPQSDGSWRAGSGASFDLRSNDLRPRGWTSADAAGLSILAGLVRYEEVAAGRIDHAIRITAPRTATSYVWPARHAASDLADPNLPQMGTRLRLRPEVSIAGLPRQARIVAAAMKRYGVIVADNGSPWYISGAPDERWDNDALHALDRFSGRDFEVVDTRGLMISSNSGAARSG